jgi:uncharacterized membrane protein YeaQ/YmgE (transglycosylase-associated protein family)
MKKGGYLEVLTNLERKLKLDTRDLVLLESELREKQKSNVAGYILWHVLGWFGGHRFYFRKFKSAIAQLVLGIIGIVALESLLISLAFDTPLLTVSLAALVVGAAIMPTIDAFMIYHWVRTHNDDLENQLITKYETKGITNHDN